MGQEGSRKTQGKILQAYDGSFYNDEGIYDWTRSIIGLKADAYEKGKQSSWHYTSKHTGIHRFESEWQLVKPEKRISRSSI